jgi:acyl carrier protein
MKDRILQFLSNAAAGAPRPVVGLDTNLFDEGILDSFRLVEFVTFLEAETGLSISADDINDDRFTSVAGILEVLAAKRHTNDEGNGGHAQ